MGRVLGASARNELKITDNLTGGELLVYYRMPTTKQRLNYASKSVQRKGTKVTFNHGPVRQEYGAKIITGFRTGDFTDESGAVIASEKDAPEYNAAWKGLIETYAADVLEVLAIFVFESSVAVSRPDGEEPDEQPDDEEDEAGDEAGDDEPKKEELAPDDASGNLQET